MNPRVRRNLDITSTRDGRFLLSDGRYETAFIVTENERYLYGLLDGTRTPGEVIDQYQERFRERLSSRNLEEFLEQLRVHHLLEETDRDTDGGRGPSATEEDVSRGVRRPRARAVRKSGRAQRVARQRAARASRLNRVFDLLLVAFGWIVHPIWCVPIAVGAVFAARELVGNFGLFSGEVLRLAAALPIPILVLLMAIRVFVVDLSSTVVRGMALRKHGARLERFQLTLYHWVLPVFVCDAGSSVRRLDARGRAAQLTSRIWVELALGSIAILGWQHAEWGSLTRQFCLMLAIPVLFGLALQLNPFIRLDASRILARWVDRPNLYADARAEVRAWVLGRLGPQGLGRSERVWMRLYGLGSYLSTITLHIVVLAGGLWLHTELYGRAGAYWWGFLGALWYGSSIRKALPRALGALPEGSWIRGGGPWYVRWSARVVLVGILLLLAFIPYKREIIGEARLVPAAEHGLRTQISDEIIEVLVAEGDVVSKGDLLVRLSAREVTAAMASTEAELARARANLEGLEAGPRIEDIEAKQHQVDRLQSELEYQELQLSRQSELFEEETVSREALDQAQRRRDNAAERLAQASRELDILHEGARAEEIRATRAQVEYYEAQLARHRRDLALTELRAPISGQVTTANLEQRVGQMAEKGDLILVVQDTSSLRVEIVAPEEAAVWVEPGMEVKVRLRALDGVLLMARVESVARFVSRGQTVVPTPVRSDREQFTEETRERDTEDFGVRVVARLEDELPRRSEATSEGPSDEWAAVGMTGEARIVVGPGVLGVALLRPMVRFVRTEVWSWLP